MIPLYIKKAWRDLSSQKMKTVFILISLTICLAVIGALLNTNFSFNQAFRTNAEKTNASDLTIYTSPFTDDISSLTNVKGIKEAEAKLQIRARVKIGSEFENFEIMAFSADPLFTINKVTAEPRPSNTSRDELFLEKSTMKYFKLAIGDKLLLSIPGKQPKPLTIKGTVEDFSRIPTRFTGLGFGYLPKETLAGLGQPAANNLIHVTFDSSLSETQKSQLIQEAKTELQSKNITVFRTEFSEETLFLRKTVVNTILLLLMVLGGFAFFLGFLLNIHLFHRIVSEQVAELSIQKVLGATSHYLWKQFSAVLILLGSIVFLFSFPLGTAVSYFFTSYIFGELNMGKTSFTFSPKAGAVMLGLSFIVPILAASFPIQKVLKISVIQGLQKISRPYGRQKKKNSKRYFHYRTLSIRNSMTKKTQLITNILMLSFGGAIIIACAGLNHSLQLTLKDINRFWNYDSEWSIRTSLQAENLVQLITEIKGVKEAEAWTSRNAVISHSSSKRNVLLHALPYQTKLIQPKLMEGGWLDQQIPNGIVISSDLKQTFKNIKPGDSITVQIGREEKQWKVAGIVKEQLEGPTIYMNQTEYHQWLNTPESNRLLIKTDEGQTVTGVQNAVETWLAANQVEIEASDTVSNMKSRPEEIIRLIVYSLLFFGILFSGVGILNLVTAMSINVLERKKEIGIIRSIGGCKSRIYQLFIGEGIFIAVISWLLAALLSYPLNTFLSSKIGDVLLKSPLASGRSFDGSLLWLGVSLLIGIIGSYLPTRKAVNRPVSELL